MNRPAMLTYLLVWWLGHPPLELDFNDACCYRRIRLWNLTRRRGSMYPYIPCGCARRDPPSLPSTAHRFRGRRFRLGWPAGWGGGPLPVCGVFRVGDSLWRGGEMMVVEGEPIRCGTRQRRRTAAHTYTHLEIDGVQTQTSLNANAHMYTRTIVRLASKHPDPNRSRRKRTQTHRAVVIEVSGVVHGEVVLGVLPDHGGAVEPGGVVHGGVEVAVAVCVVGEGGRGSE